MKNKTLKRLLTILFGLAFLGSTVVFMVGSLFGSEQTASSPTSSQSIPSPEERLLLQARGYEKVLDREPENITALSGLVRTRLDMQDLEGAITPLEKLIELNPQRAELTTLLETIKQELAQKQQPEQVEENNTEQ
ncbi:MAG: tetratricopeptide repeat protein [Xenococcaceae cyanobacterium MO_188.B29]|nr:tetratricopeptide repeat protein [Xenococcaceae cyanobacterium MO_188.B29]